MAAGSASAQGDGRAAPLATRTFDALGHRFVLLTTDAGLRRVVDDLYGPCAVSGEPHVVYELAPVPPSNDRWELRIDGDVAASLEHPGRLLRYLTWHVNQEVVRSIDRHVLVHAAAATRDGVGLLMPGAPESGKTTLVAGLVRTGYRYLTDEAAAIDPASLRVLPYPKPLSLDEGSWAVVPEFAPPEPEVRAGFHDGQWQVAVRSLRTDAVASAAPIALVVFPRYVAGAPLQVRRVTRADALLRTMQQTFGFHRHGRRNLETLGRVLQHALCYEMLGGDLTAACRAVDGLFDEGATHEGEGVDPT